MTRALAAKALKAIVSKARETGVEGVRSAAESAVGAGQQGFKDWVGEHRVPIQLSLDIAAPLHVVWDEWMAFESLPEGIHRVEQLEHGDGTLSGMTAGPRAIDWEAEITDEREHESFAWHSVEGSDCAGLATFHQLGDRLTRVELDLDVLPTTARDALALSLHLAHRRAEADLRRFKARVEFISPDAYEPPPRRNGGRASATSKRRGGKSDADRTEHDT
jgi:uncharacterized membrane protein